MKIGEHNLKKIDNLKTLGISLSIAGVPLGMYLNWFFPFVEWSPIIMFVSVVLIFNWGNLFRFRFPSMSPVLKIVIGFQLLMLLYGLIDERGTMTTQYLSFHLFVIAICFAYALQNRFLELSKVTKYIFGLSSILSILGGFLCFQGFVVGDDVWKAKQYTDDYALEPFTVASGVLINFFSAMVITKKNRLENILVFMFFILDIYVLFKCGKRTPIFVASIGTILYLYKRGMLSLHNFKTFLKYIPILCLCFVFAYLKNEEFNTLVNDFIENFYKGILVLFGNTNVSDASGSASARVEARDFMFNYINLEFSFPNYLFGGGYMVRWLDAPILQSYLDMGILGFILYSYLIVYVPIKYMKYKTLNNLQLFALLNTLYPLLSMLNSGHPYMYNKYTGICLLAFVCCKQYLKVKKKYANYE